MNKRLWLLSAFVLAALAQLAVPTWMIRQHELTLREGQVFLFRTRPVDPIDAFRGRFVWLSLEPASVKPPKVNDWTRGQKAYAVLGTDTNGFATVLRLERGRPADEPAIAVRVNWPEVDSGEIHFSWEGLDRYYMTERKAPAAEKAYWQHNVRSNRTCHVAVRVRGNQASIEELFIENRPIRLWLEEHPAAMDLDRPTI